MCINLLSFQWVKSDVNFEQLANIQTVGIGLYLALAFIQAISTTGVSGLSRRIVTLRQGVSSARLGSTEMSNVRSLSGEVTGLEIGFHDMNRRFLWMVFILFSFSVGYFAYCTAWQGIDAGQDGVWFIYTYYLALPVLIFLGSSLLIAFRCRKVAKKVHMAEKRIRSALLNVN